MLIVQRYNCYEKELSESSDERYLYYGWESVTTPSCTIFFYFSHYKRCRNKSLLASSDGLFHTQNEQCMCDSAIFHRIEHNKKCLEEYFILLFLKPRYMLNKKSSKHFLLYWIRRKLALAYIDCSFWVKEKSSKQVNKNLFVELFTAHLFKKKSRSCHLPTPRYVRIITKIMRKMKKIVHGGVVTDSHP